jgi:hypothetical protein
VRNRQTIAAGAARSPTPTVRELLLSRHVERRSASASASFLSPSSRDDEACNIGDRLELRFAELCAARRLERQRSFIETDHGRRVTRAFARRAVTVRAWCAVQALTERHLLAESRWSRRRFRLLAWRGDSWCWPSAATGDQREHSHGAPKNTYSSPPEQRVEKEFPNSTPRTGDRFTWSGQRQVGKR